MYKKELLYIPSGKVIRFFDVFNNVLSGNPTLCLSDFLLTEEGRSYGSVEVILENILNHDYIDEIYDFAEIPKTGELTKSEFTVIFYEV